MDFSHGSMAIVLVVDDDVEVALGRVTGARPDLALVDGLARLQLRARRMGCSIRLDHPCPELCRLLHLVGLAEVLGAAPGP